MNPRELTVAHQKPGECAYCDKHHADIVAAVFEKAAALLRQRADLADMFEAGSGTARGLRMASEILGGPQRGDPIADAVVQPALTDAERRFLTFALDQAAEEMSLRDGFTAEDEAALAALRKLAGGEQA